MPFTPGDNWAICDLTGKKVLMSQTRKTWDGLRVWEKVWYPRHPQLDIRAIPDRMAVQDARPRPVDADLVWPYGYGSFCLVSPNGVYWTFAIADDGALIAFNVQYGRPIRYLYIGAYRLYVDDDGALHPELSGSTSNSVWKMRSPGEVVYDVSVDETDGAVLQQLAHGISEGIDGHIRRNYILGNRDQLIGDAFLEMGTISPGEPLTAGMISYASRALNMLIVSKRVKERGLWLNRKFQMALAYNTPTYLLGPTGWHCTYGAFNYATLNGALAAGATAITVAAITGISNADYIGIQLADGTMQWTSVNGVPAGSSVSLAAALTGAANDKAAVFSYTTKVDRPLGISYTNLLYADGNELNMTPLSRQEYTQLPLKLSPGTPVQYYFDPQRTNAELSIWQTPSDVSCRLNGTLNVPVQVFVNTSDEPEFPIEWYRALKFGLAVELSPGYKVPNDVFQKLVALSDNALDDVEGFDREDTSVYFAPDMGQE